jgi:clan AA aspartic protease (TIGR02281 family)
LRTFAAIAAIMSIQACAPAPSQMGPSARQVCADGTGRRVEDQLCRGAASETPYNWYYFDVGAPVPPIGSRLAGGSLIATNGVSYVTASGDEARERQGLLQAPSSATPPSASETIVARDPTGAFVINGAVNGRPVTFVVDTGASDVLLSPSDALNVGFDPGALHYDRVYQTANGVGRAASFQAHEISVGGISIDNVPAAINQAPMRYSLLGRTFLDRLSAFRIEHGRLHLQ